MSALLKTNHTISSHYWMLWIAPTRGEINKIRALPLHEQQRVLMLHPKTSSQLYAALEAAIVSDLYQSVTLDRSLIPVQQHRLLEITAMQHKTHVNWLNKRRLLNSASQLSLI